jgi:hypothetical protein
VADDRLQHARSLASAGRYDEALRVAWRDVLPAVTAHDYEQIQGGVRLADAIAEQTTGSTNADAVKLSRYCAACLDTPSESLLERLSFASLFSRRPRRRRCPDCAEDIAAEARVCRHCGYRLAEAPSQDR